MGSFAGARRKVRGIALPLHPDATDGIADLPQVCGVQFNGGGAQILLELSFDSDAADMYAEIAASRRTAGKPISQFDAMIVAMAGSRGASLATRNVEDFEDCGVDVLNPWTM